MNTYILTIFLTFTTIFAEKNGQSLLTGNNLFTASVYKEVLKQGEKNFLISPFSAETVLAFAQSGATGKTAEELHTSLHLPNDQNKIEADFKSLLPKLKSEGLYSFHTANKLYLKENFSIKDGFKRIANDVFHADLENIQFTPKTNEAAEIINKWVEHQTQNKIRNLISPSSLTEDTTAILINALYFKGNWTTSFKKFNTKKKNFYQIDKKETQVDMMWMYDIQSTFNYAENEELGAKFLELPFEGEDVSMVLVLPNEKDGIGNLEKQIEKVFVPQNFVQEHVKISVPKFKTESKIDFKEVLTNLGVRKAFTRGEADFRGISDNKLVIDKVLQKTYIDVNEDGVEAAAATSVEFNKYSAHILTNEPKEFYADHPFIYYIQVNGLIVFAGRVGAPIY